MSDIIFEILKLAVMVAALVITRYVIPWLRAQVDNEALTLVAKWASKAVHSTQQVMASESGAEKKAVVTQFLKEILTAKNISLSDSQIDALIEAAVKEMKNQENSGVTISTVYNGSDALNGIEMEEEDADTAE